MTACKASHGSGKASTELWEKLLWRKNAWGRTPRTGGKKGRKRSLLVDGRGVPLSLVASGANVGDRDLLPATLDGMVAKRPKPGPNRPQHLCGDAGYRGKPAWNAARSRHYRPHIKQRKEEAQAKRTHQATKPAAGWWNGATPGSTASANFSSASRKPKPVTLPYFL